MRATVSLPHRSQKESWGAVNRSAAEEYVRSARWVTSDQPDVSTIRGYCSATASAAASRSATTILRICNIASVAAVARALSGSSISS